MFCPRCSAQITEGLKYCRNCGLPISQISSYVATGGTANLAPVSPSGPLSTEDLTPKQWLAVPIMLLVLSPAIVAVFAEALNLNSELAAIPAVLMPVGIILAIFHYKAQIRRLRELQQPQGMMPPPTVYAAQPLPPHRTNPLADVTRGSVVEDETRRLPEERNS